MSLYELRPTVATRQVGWMLGLALSAQCYGALLTLSVGCIVHLHHTAEPTGGYWTQRHIFQGYIVLVLLLNTASQASNIETTIRDVFYSNPDRITGLSWILVDVLVSAVLMLTDGLLVWRCYMVQKALLGDSPARLHHICWIIPLCLWFSTAALGLASYIMMDLTLPVGDQPQHSPEGFTAFCALLSNIMLNLFATSNIIIRLLYHRRKILATLGPSEVLGDTQLRVTGILLESAALNIPVTLLSLIMLWRKQLFTDLVLQCVVPLQSMASVIVIYQVAKRKRYPQGGRPQQERKADNCNTHGVRDISGNTSWLSEGSVSDSVLHIR